MASLEPDIIPDFSGFDEEEFLNEIKHDAAEAAAPSPVIATDIYSQQIFSSQDQLVDCGEVNPEFNLRLWNVMDNAEVVMQEPNEDLDSGSENENFDISKYMCTAADLEEHYLTSGCSEIDTFLKGGFPAFGITEISGESGSGKTQICLQLSLVSQLPEENGGLNSSVLYICTEKEFPSIRLHGLTRVFKHKYGDKLPINPMNNVFVEHIVSEEDLRHCLDVKMDALARRQANNNKLRLVILDSIAGIFRCLESAKINWEERADKIRSVAQTLAEFSYNNKAVIIVCNQITADLTIGSSVAALGMAWRNVTTTRIRLQKYIGQRTMKVTESPHIPSSTISFVIDAEGVRAA